MNNIKKDNGAAPKNIINEQIRAEEIHVIDQQGQNIGIVSRSQALALARENDLDLVQVGDKDGVPIARVMNFGKFLYEKKKQLNDAKKHHKVIQIKEIKLRPHIGEGDYTTKLNQAEGFFKDGKKVKFTLQFKGREIITMSDYGKKFFERITADLHSRDVGALIEEKDARAGSLWSKIYAVKSK